MMSHLAGDRGDASLPSPSLSSNAGFSPVNTSNCDYGILFSSEYFLFPLKPFPSHELPFLFSLLYPVVIRGFCFSIDLENFLPGIQILASDVRLRDNGPLLALG